MKILVLNGLPRAQGQTAAMVSAFAASAIVHGHEIDVIDVCKKHISGCMACEYCHQKGSGHERECVQHDGMVEIYPLLDAAEMIVLASPVYYHGFSGQLQCAINRIYALDKPKRLRKAALILASGSPDVYGGAVYEYRNSFLYYLKLEDMGVYTAAEDSKNLNEVCKSLRELGARLDESDAPMKLPEFLAAFEAGEPVRQGSQAMRASAYYSQEALKITTEINGGYHTPDEIRLLMCRLIGQELDENFGLFPPFYTDCGKNIKLGHGVFINAGCKFQDQGGIEIGDGALIGHNAMLATLNHGVAPAERHDLFPKPIKIGRNVWLGANVTVIGGVTIGDNAVIAAGAVVTRDVPANTIAAGVPARIVGTTGS